MYVLPSTSFTVAPLPSLMKTGVPPTALNARTGELTPPGMSWRALRNADSEFASERLASAASGIAANIPVAEAGGAGAAGLGRRTAAGILRDATLRRPGRPIGWGPARLVR